MSQIQVCERAKSTRILKLGNVNNSQIRGRLALCSLSAISPSGWRFLELTHSFPCCPSRSKSILLYSSWQTHIERYVSRGWSCVVGGALGRAITFHYEVMWCPVRGPLVRADVNNQINVSGVQVAKCSGRLPSFRIARAVLVKQGKLASFKKVL